MTAWDAAAAAEGMSQNGDPEGCGVVVFGKLFRIVLSPDFGSLDGLAVSRAESDAGTRRMRDQAPFLSRTKLSISCKGTKRIHQSMFLSVAWYGLRQMARPGCITQAAQCPFSSLLTCMASGPSIAKI